MARAALGSAGGQASAAGIVAFWTVFNAFGRLQVRLMHLTRGRVGGKLMGVPVLVLHHRGRRSGQARETPLMYLEDGADVVVVGSKGGTERTPRGFTT